MTREALSLALQKLFELCLWRVAGNQIILNSIPLFKNPIASYSCSIRHALQDQELEEVDQKQESVMEDRKAQTTGYIGDRMRCKG